MVTKMNPMPNTPSDDDNKIPLRLLVLATVALLAGAVVGGLAMLSTGEVGAALLAGGAGAAGSFAWLTENVT